MEYISHEDFKGMMNKLQGSTPKGILKEAVDVKDRGYNDNITPESPLDEEDMEEGNAFTGQLHTHKPGEKFKVGGKEYKDTAKGVVPEASYTDNYPGSWGYRENEEMEEGHQAGAILKDQRGNHAEIELFNGDHEYDVVVKFSTSPAQKRGLETEPLEAGIEEWDVVAMKEDGRRLSKEEIDMVIEEEGVWDAINDAVKQVSLAEDMEEGMGHRDLVSKILQYVKDPEDAEYYASNPQSMPAWLKHFIGKDKKEDMPGFGGTWDALGKLGIKEETKEASDGSHMRDPAYAAKVVAQKHGKELKDLRDIYDTRSDAEPKVRNQAYKDYENAAISWCGHEMLEAGLKRVVVQNLLSGYGYFEDWAPDYLESLKDELGKIEEGLNEENKYSKIIPALKARGIKYGMPEKEIIKAIGEVMKELGYAQREISYSLGYDEDFIPDLLHDLKRSEGDMEEGLHMPPLQATGQTIQTVEEVTNETNPPYGFSVLSPDERKQLAEYIKSVKTIKSEIAKLLEKAGKDGKIMESDKAGYVKGGEIKNKRKEHDIKHPAATKPHYQEPSHKSKPGGNRTGLVLKKGEMWESHEPDMDPKHQEMESNIDPKLHDVLHKVADKIIGELMSAGFTRHEALMFLDHEIAEKGEEAKMAQYDL